MHEKAAEAYDAKMTEMVAQLHERPAEQIPMPDTSPSATDAHSVKTLGPSDLDITKVRLSTTDYTGENIACYFYAAGKMIGLDGDAHKTLLATTKRIASNHDYGEHLSEKYVYDQAIRWLQARANTVPEIEESFTTFLDARAALDVTETELWFPIPILQIDVEFTIGPAVFRRSQKQ